MNDPYCNHDIPAIRDGICECGAVIRQIVYRYPARDPGTGDFAVWHLGTAQVTVYGAEGRVLRVLKMITTARIEADEVVRAHGPVELITASTNLYPASAS